MPKVVKAKEDAMPVVEKPVRKKEEVKEKRPWRKLPDEAYQVGCWVSGGQHRRGESWSASCVKWRKVMLHRSV